MVSLKSSGADTFFNITTPKFAAQAIKKAAEIGWKPTHYLNSVSSFRRHGADAGRAGGLDRHHHRAATSRTRPTRSSRRARNGTTSSAFMKKYHPTGAMNDNFNCLRLHRGAADDACAEAGRRQPDARERHEAGRQPGPDAADVAARREHQDLRPTTSTRSNASNWPSSTARPGNCSARSTAADGLQPGTDGTFAVPFFLLRPCR